MEGGTGKKGRKGRRRWRREQACDVTGSGVDDRRVNAPVAWFQPSGKRVDAHLHRWLPRRRDLKRNVDAKIKTRKILLPLRFVKNFDDPRREALALCRSTPCTWCFSGERNAIRTIYIHHLGTYGERELESKREVISWVSLMAEWLDWNKEWLKGVDEKWSRCTCRSTVE